MCFLSSEQLCSKYVKKGKKILIKYKVIVELAWRE